MRVDVKDPRSVGSRKLGQTIHHLSTQVELLPSELDGLQRKLYLKQKPKKQARRQLDLQQHQEYHGGAMVWSRAVQEARVRVAVTERDKEEEELRKAGMKDIAAANKLYKDKG